jgi:hypothetical protein
MVIKCRTVQAPGEEARVSVPGKPLQAYSMFVSKLTNREDLRCSCLV